MPRWLQFAVFFGIFTSILLLIHYYLFRRFTLWLSPMGQPAERSLFWFLAAMALSFPVSRIFVRFYAGWLSKSIDWAASIWLGLLFYLVVFTIAVMLAGHLANLALWLAGRQPDIWARAGRIAAALVTASAVLVCAAGIWYARFTLDVKRIDVQAKDLPAGLDGFKIAQISDLHIGMLVSNSMARKVVERVNSLDPDLVVITGDLVDESASHLDGTSAELGKLRSKHGVLACTGNHEFYAGVDMVERWASKAGIEFLRNNSKEIAGGLLVVGRDDPASAINGARPPELEQLLSKVAGSGKAEKGARFVLLLQHQPRELEKAAALGARLVLAGHTHKGQIFPIEYISKLIYKHENGRFDLGGSTFYITSGAGTWGPPMRLDARPEVALVTLRAK